MKDKKLVFKWLSELPVEHPFWKNDWLFTRYEFLQESRQMQDQKAFWKWFDEFSAEFHAYVINSAISTHVVHGLINDAKCASLNIGHESRPSPPVRFHLVEEDPPKPTILERLRNHYNEWQSQGYETRPDNYDDMIDEKINRLSNVELLELIELLS